MKNAHIDALKGRSGRIYIARKRTVMVFVLDDGTSYMAGCVNPSNVMTVNPVADYWQHSIDWAGAAYEYPVFGMKRDPEDKPFYPAAEPLVGRPAKMDGGKRVNVYLDKTSLQRAEELGKGNVSAGIRKSLSDSAALKNRSKS